MKRKFYVNDDIAEGFYEIGKVFDSFFPVRTYTFGGTVVDTDLYDIVPKQKLFDEQIKRSEEEIAALDRQHESEEKYYQNARKRLVEHKEYLLREKEKKSIDKV
jgi:hypothetical protein